MNSQTIPQFWRWYDRLPRQIQKRANVAINVGEKALRRMGYLSNMLEQNDQFTLFVLMMIIEL